MKKHAFSRFFYIVLFLGVSFNSTSVQATSGNDWDTFTDDIKKAYVMGVLDTWKALESGCKGTAKANCTFNETINLTLSSCFKKSPYNQLFAIVAKHMKEFPENWHQSMVWNIWDALDRGCKR